MLGCPLLGSHHAHLGKLITAGRVLPEAGRYLVAIEWRHVERTDQDGSRSCIIDGEAVACDDNGVPACQAVRPESSRWSYHRP